MKDRAFYSRVYWAIVDDPKFEDIWADDHHLATWLRLLIIADQSWPTSAQLPSGCRPSSVIALRDAGLVDQLTTRRYRIHGLDAERERRSASAAHAASQRWGNAPGNATGSTARNAAGNAPGNAETMLGRGRVENRGKRDSLGTDGARGKRPR